MQTRVSSKGQIVLPVPFRRRLGIRAGDPLEANIEGESIILTPRRKTTRKGRIVADPVTGLPVLSAGEDSPVLCSKDVAEILSNFP
ncbi:MAG TPA: AbrB/MazE/SpoVT family DNA-binding domain-containing protein [Acidobacteriaceae bacterium]|nr:AbrB/MazE/SpoVT family DNA-binding domain-containing protein [Acidobacteriaceae bacterium]